MSGENQGIHTALEKKSPTQKKCFVKRPGVGVQQNGHVFAQSLKAIVIVT